MKLKLTQAGYENMTGTIGHIDFVDGVSAEGVTPDMARSLGTVVRVEVIDEAAPAPAAKQPDLAALAAAEAAALAAHEAAAEAEALAAEADAAVIAAEPTL